MQLLTVDNIRNEMENYLFKMVRMSTGEVRLFNHHFKHREAVSVGEKAVGAGTFVFWPGNPSFIRVEDSFSTTLGVGLRPEDEEILGKMFGLKIKGKWEDR